MEINSAATGHIFVNINLNHVCWTQTKTYIIIELRLLLIHVQFTLLSSQISNGRPHNELKVGSRTMVSMRRSFDCFIIWFTDSVKQMFVSDWSSETGSKRKKEKKRRALLLWLLVKKASLPKQVFLIGHCLNRAYCCRFIIRCYDRNFSTMWHLGNFEWMQLRPHTS